MICIANDGYPASLEVRKLYALLAPLANDPKSCMRVVDESGEDYLYPRRFFRHLTIPRVVLQALARARVTA